MSRIVTGIKPTGTPHLGNYYGMIRPALELARTHSAYYFVADGHALNGGPSPAELSRRSREVAATMLALGLDPTQTALYRQSDVPEVFELAQILAAVTPKGLLNRAHAYKAATAANEEAGNDPDVGVNMGLFTYPLLMAADILVVGADLVPVGADQRQHVEISRDIAAAFNARYGPVLPMPEGVVDESTMKLPGTDGRKMSKSYGNVIPILGSPDDVRRSVMSIVTDSRPVDEPKDPTDDVLFLLFAAAADQDEADGLADHYRRGGVRYGDVKQRLAEILTARFSAASDRYTDYLAGGSELDDVLAAGASRARTQARALLSRVKEAVGLAVAS